MDEARPLPFRYEDLPSIRSAFLSTPPPPVRNRDQSPRIASPAVVEKPSSAPAQVSFTASTQESQVQRPNEMPELQGFNRPMVPMPVKSSRPRIYWPVIFSVAILSVAIWLSWTASQRLDNVEGILNGLNSHVDMMDTRIGALEEATAPLPSQDPIDLVLAGTARIMPELTSQPYTSWLGIFYKVLRLDYPSDVAPGGVLQSGPKAKCWPIGQEAMLGIRLEGSWNVTSVELTTNLPAKFWVMGQSDEPFFWTDTIPIEHQLDVLASGVTRSKSDTGKPAILNYPRNRNVLVIVMRTGGFDCANSLKIMAVDPLRP